MELSFDRNINELSLQTLIDAKSQKLSKEQKDLLNIELQNVLNRNNPTKIMIALKISEYLKSHNYFYYLASPLTSSFLAYILGIHNVDTFNYNINPMFCYGKEYDKDIYLEYRVSKYNKDRIIKDLKNNIFKDRFLSIESNDNEFIILTDEIIKDKITTEDTFTNSDKVVRLVITSQDEVTIIDETLKEFNVKDFNDLLKEIKNNKNIFNNLIKYYDYLNIEKSYLPVFNSNEINEIIKDFKPNNYSDLIKVIAMNFDNNVWKYNQKSFYKRGDIKKNDIITSRDDIYDFLMNKGFSESLAFDIAEVTRKGALFRYDKYITKLREKGIPEQTINILFKIIYLPARSVAISLLHIAMLMEYFKEKNKDLLFGIIRKVYELDNKLTEKELLNSIWNHINQKLSIDEDDERINEIDEELKRDKLSILLLRDKI